MQGAEDRDVSTETAEGNDNHHNIYASRILLTSFWTKMNLFQDVHLRVRTFLQEGRIDNQILRIKELIIPLTLHFPL